MTTPIETLNWLAEQFRDRASETREQHTETDASEVEAAMEWGKAALAALRAAETQLAEVVDCYSPDTIPEDVATCQPFTDALATVRAAIARAEGREG